MRNLVVICAAFIVSLIVLEMAARSLTSEPISQPWMMVDDQGLTINRPNTQATHFRGDVSASYRINGLHMRGEMPATDVPSIMVLGDSFTFGWLVDGKDTLVQHLQDQADTFLGKGRVQFLNAGTGGWGTASYIDFFARYSKSLEPAGVLVFANATDFNRAVQTGLYEVGDDLSVHRVVSVPSAAMWLKQLITNNSIYRWLVGRSYLLNMLKQAVLNLMYSEDDVAPAGAEMLMNDKIDAPTLDVQNYNSALIAHLKSLADERAIPIFVASQYHWQYSNDVYDWLEPEMKALGIPFFASQRDLDMVTNGDVSTYFIDGDPHPNGKTYKLLAEKTWKWLMPQLKELSIGQ